MLFAAEDDAAGATELEDAPVTTATRTGRRATVTGKVGKVVARTRPAGASPSPKASPKASSKAKAKAKPKAGARRKPPAKGTAQSETRAPARSQKRSPARKTKGSTKAHELATKQREISVSEFFAKNRHLLGFDSKRKALLTSVKEAVDNALDACEEADILPEITVRLEVVKGKDDRYRVTVSDNGPGILPEQVDNVFAKLLYGSKFHRLRQSRGQQGIGISAAGMYGQMTTGVPTKILSRIGRKHDAHEIWLRIDTHKNLPVRTRHQIVDWESEHGTAVTIELEAKYQKGRGSVDEYLALTAIANPHVQITYFPPDLGQRAEPTVYERATKQLPEQPKEIKPHPHGIELGFLMKMMKATKSSRLAPFLHADFSRVSAKVAREICAAAKLDPDSRVKSLEHKSAEALYKAINAKKLMNPPTDCVSPIGEDLIRKGLSKEIGEAEFFVSRTRPPSVYRGNPFQVEVGVALGGSLPAEDTARVMRFANRVPLQHQPGGCAITKAVTSVDWRSYGLSQPRDSLPVGPVILMVHLASAWVPFTSESKEAIASYPEILKELKLALQECGRQMQIHLRRRARVADELKKRAYIDKYIPHIGEALQEMLKITDTQKAKVIAKLRDTLEKSRKLG
jgi:DNA topoisomerase-6 subunit B